MSKLEKKRPDKDSPQDSPQSPSYEKTEKSATDPPPPESVYVRPGPRVYIISKAGSFRTKHQVITDQLTEAVLYEVNRISHVVSAPEIELIGSKGSLVASAKLHSLSKDFEYTTSDGMQQVTKSGLLKKTFTFDVAGTGRVDTYIWRQPSAMMSRDFELVAAAEPDENAVLAKYSPKTFSIGSTLGEVQWGVILEPKVEQACLMVLVGIQEIIRRANNSAAAGASGGGGGGC